MKKRSFFIYIEESSPLVGLHPTIKILLLMAVNVLAWVMDAPIALTLLLAALLLAFKISRVPIARLKRFLLYVLLVSQAVIVSYTLGSKIPGEITFVNLPWGAYITEKTLLYMATVVLRLTCMLVGSTLILSVLRDTDVVYGLLGLGVPYRAAFTFNLALRSSIMFLDDYSKVRDAMVLRGAKLDSGGIVERGRNYSKMGIPLVVIALRRMTELSYILDIKGLSRKGRRTYLYEYKWYLKDILMVTAIFSAIVVALVFRFIFGHASFPGWPFQ